MKRTITNLLVTFSLLISLSACNTGGKDNKQEQLVLMLALLTVVNQAEQANANGYTEEAKEDYVRYINWGLDSWQIGMKKNLTAADRFNGDSYNLPNPKNWITVANDCNAVGVPEKYKSQCSIKDNNVIGVCYSAHYSVSGEIAYTTILIRKSYYDDPSNGDLRKRMVASHEIGHCLGLKHTNFANHVMQPYAFEGEPQQPELDAIAEAYLPIGAPSTTTTNNYYSTTSSGNAHRHFEIPEFIISGQIFPISGAQSTISYRDEAISQNPHMFDERLNEFGEPLKNQYLEKGQAVDLTSRIDSTVEEKKVFPGDQAFDLIHYEHVLYEDGTEKIRSLN